MSLQTSYQNPNGSPLARRERAKMKSAAQRSRPAAKAEAPEIEDVATTPKGRGKKTKKVAPVYILVENTTAKMFGIGEPPPRGKDGTLPSGVTAIDPSVKLIPGINKIKTKDWERAQKQVMVKAHLDQGDFKEHYGVSELKDLPLPDALRVIPQVFDRELLNEWKETDERKQVQDKLTQQFRAFQKALEGGRARTNDLVVQ